MLTSYLRVLVLSIITNLCELFLPQIKTFAYSEATSSWVWWQKPSPCGVELSLHLGFPLLTTPHSINTRICPVGVPTAENYPVPLQSGIKIRKSTQTLSGGTRETGDAIYCAKCGRRHLIFLLSIVLGVQKGWIHFIQCHIIPCCHGISGNRQM
jgi:hypothetical protein